MNRIPFDDGRWFDADQAKLLSPENRSALYELEVEDVGGFETLQFTKLWRTRNDTFIVDDPMGEHGGNSSISPESAVRAMIKYGFDVPEDLQDEVDGLEG